MASILNATTSSGLVTSADNSGSLQLATNSGTTAVTIDTSQNVGIGTASPTSKLDVTGAISLNNVAIPSAGTARLYSRNTNSSLYMQTGSGNALYLLDGSQNSMASFESSTVAFLTGNTERMRIDSNGNLLVNTTAKFGTGFPAQIAVLFDDSTTQGMGLKVSGSASGADYVVFRNSSNTNIGSITRNGTSNAVLFNTTSDYRLKENVTPLSNALDKVSALKPVSWVWKDCDGATGEGFIAHEVQEIIPSAVNGVKDAVDEEGNIKPQGMDASYLVATLTAAIQELNAKVDAQALEIQALKGVA
jgi:hypothetical protein